MVIHISSRTELVLVGDGHPVHVRLRVAYFRWSPAAHIKKIGASEAAVASRMAASEKCQAPRAWHQGTGKKLTAGAGADFLLFCD